MPHFGEGRGAQVSQPGGEGLESRPTQEPQEGSDTSLGEQANAQNAPTPTAVLAAENQLQSAESQDPFAFGAASGISANATPLRSVRRVSSVEKRKVMAEFGLSDEEIDESFDDDDDLPI